MKERNPIPEIADVVRRWMPDATEDKLKVATTNLRGYLAVVYRIFLRHEAESLLPCDRDNPEINDRVGVSNDN